MYEQGDVLLAYVPYTDLKDVKQRPVLVLSVSAYNQNSQDLLVCGITSNLENTPYSVPIEAKDFVRGSITKPSLVKVNHLFTLGTSLILRRLGTVNANVIAKTKAVLATLV